MVVNNSTLDLTPTIVDDLTKEGKVKLTTKGNFAKTGIGAAVKQGAQKPDISSVEALKKTLVQAKSIAYSKEGLSGTAMAGIIERLGLTKDLAQKTILETRVGGTPLNLIEGKADLAFALISEILPVQGIELVAPLPAELQTYVVFTSGLSSSSKAKAAAAAFIDFVKAPAALPVLKANGMEPG